MLTVDVTVVRVNGSGGAFSAPKDQGSMEALLRMTEGGDPALQSARSEVEGKLDAGLLLLDAGDSVVVARQPLRSGEMVQLEGGGPVAISGDAGVGFKIARRSIASGEKILKYGAPIGTATRAIVPGEVVHLHNMKSDYLPTFTRDEGGMRATTRRTK